MCPHTAIYVSSYSIYCPKTEGSESAQIAYEVAKQFAIADHSREWTNNTTTQEDGAATRQLY
jgi:hypothetical protein